MREAEIIFVCVRWYLRYALSYRDLTFLHPDGVEKVGIYFLIEREKDHTKGTMGIHAGIQARGGAPSTDQWEKPGQVARDLEIADSTFSHWCKRYRQHRERAFPGSGHQKTLQGARGVLSATLATWRKDAPVRASPGKSRHMHCK